MPTSLTLKADESSTYVINIAPKDENGDAVVPTAGSWTLTDLAGNVINSREDISISIPSASMDVVLSGDDLAMTSNNHKTEGRRFLFEGEYTSSLGSGLSLKQSCEFDVQNLLAV